jgi:hypothetical protein
MMLPKIDVEVGESVHREAMRDLVKYAKDKALELNKENIVLSTLAYDLSNQIGDSTSLAIKKKLGHKDYEDLILEWSESGDLSRQIYFAMLVALNIVNTQMEVNELKEMYS